MFLINKKKTFIYVLPTRLGVTDDDNTLTWLTWSMSQTSSRMNVNAVDKV